MAVYGWFLKHKRSGQLLRIDSPQLATIVSSLVEATRFDTQAQATAALEFVKAGPMMGGIELEVVDATIHDPPIPDANPEVVPTREEILQAAHESGAARRAAHDEARREFNEQPSDVLVPHPGTDIVAAKVRMSPTRKRTVRK